MSSDNMKAHPTISVQQLSERWMETIRAEHESERGGIDSFESGFEAFRDLLALYSTFRKHDFFKSMLSGEATADEVVSDYRTNVLGPGLDRIVPLANGAYKVALPDGDVAVIPHTMRGDPAIVGAILTYLCRSNASDNDVPRMLTPMPYLINNAAVGPINIADRTFVGGISIWENANVLNIEGVDGEKLADFAFSYPFEREVRSIDDPGVYLKTWNQYLSDILRAINVNFSVFENSLPSGTNLFGEISKVHENDPVKSISDIFPNLKRTMQLAEVADRAFMKNHTFNGTWLNMFIRTQAAEFNNNRGPIMGGMGIIEEGDSFLQYYRWIASGFRAFTDPVKHIDKSFVAMHSQEINPGTVEYWLNASFEDGSVTKEEEIIPSNGIALRMMLDEIVYQVGAARGESAHEITFHFDGGRTVIKDKGLRGALDYYSRNEEARSRLEEQAKMLGGSGRIEFHLKGGARADGSEDGVRGSPTTSGSSAKGFRGIARSEGAKSASCETASGDMIGDEIYLDAAIADLANATGDVVRNAALGLAVSTAMSAV
jgi:hypothetical protein